MVKDIIKKTFIWFIILGTISYAVSAITGTAPTFLATRTINYGSYQLDLTYFDVKQYLQTIEHSIDIPFAKMYSTPPTFPKLSWNNWWFAIGNILLYVINMVVYILNLVVVIPTKMLISPIMTYLSIIGINLDKFGILSFVNKIYTFKPPYIEYI